MLATAWGVSRLLAVSDECNARRSPYFAGGEHLHFSLDGAWQEYGGELTPEGFYAIDAAVVLRQVEEIPSRKRAQYRRRYEMLAGMETRIRQAALGNDASLGPVAQQVFASAQAGKSVAADDVPVAAS
jgi:uncharacterized protein